MSDTRKVVVNRCFGGFGLSDAAYAKLIEWGVPVRAYIEQERNFTTGLYEPEPRNEGEVIFDRSLSSEDESQRISFMGRYWDSWIDQKRDHPLLVRVVEELGSAADGQCAKLEVVEIPADVEYTVEEYDGREHIAEVHRTW